MCRPKGFSKIDFDDFPFTYLDWIPPLTKESMKAYAKRLSIQIIN